MKVSFCIPSLNRPEYLIQTLRSICTEEKYSSQFEVCVYNNFSDSSYEIVENEIKLLSHKFNIKYTVGQEKLNIDQSMFEAIKPATGEYLFFIGDDDYLFDDGLDAIFNIIKEEEFDMALFNATRIYERDNSKDELIGFCDRKYTQLDKALLELKNYCTYGNILIKRNLIIEDDFNYLIGTSHAYGCFWLAFFRNLEEGINPTIIVPIHSVVNLRAVKKNYNLLEVVYKHANIEFEIYESVIGVKSKKILDKYKFGYWSKQFSIKQLILFGMQFDLFLINDYNPKLYDKYRTKILFARFLIRLLKPIKKPIKFIFMKK